MEGRFGRALLCRGSSSRRGENSVLPVLPWMRGYIDFLYHKSRSMGIAAELTSKSKCLIIQLLD